ncbi:phosphatase PAP2 family protein [Jatrophihabitans sp.]|jgi:undecaprenyl-diphosphatase|uniref:phosphatase PAP2 family protein n=1 Tax=Jatrophihabitans sp. TaxID=1932789 RepID=UPI002F1E7BEC
MSRLQQQPDRQPSQRQPDRGRQHPGWLASALWLLAAAVLIWLVLVLIGHLLGHQWKDSALVRWDASVDRNLAAHRREPWTEITHLATFLAETITVIAAGLVAFVLLRLALKRWREPLFLAVSLIGEVTIFVSTTLLVDRARPPVKHLDSAPPTSSFPSGHTAASVALYGGLAVIAWRVGAAAWLRTIATVLAVLVPVLVAVSRMYRGMHYPTDVIAGALLACCWLAVTSTVILGRRPAS